MARTAAGHIPSANWSILVQFGRAVVFRNHSAHPRLSSSRPLTASQETPSADQERHKHNRVWLSCLARRGLLQKLRISGTRIGPRFQAIGKPTSAIPWILAVEVCTETSRAGEETGSRSSGRYVRGRQNGSVTSSETRTFTLGPENLRLNTCKNIVQLKVQGELKRDCDGAGS